MIALIILQFQLLFLALASPIDTSDWNSLEKKALKSPLSTFQDLTRQVEENADFSLLEKGMVQSLRGKLLLDFGLYQEASVTLYEAQDIFEKEACGFCYAKNSNYLGELYYKIKGIPEALGRHQEALVIFQKLRLPEEIAKTQGFIGSMYEKLEDYPQAISNQKAALKNLEGISNSLVPAFIFENLGSIYEDLEEYDSSKLFFTKALDLNLSLNDSTHLPGNLNNLGDIERKTGNFQAALILSESARATGEKLGNLYQVKSAVVDLAKTYALMEDFDRAYIRLEEARRLDEKIFSEEAIRQLSIQEVQYQLHQKTAQINQLETEADFQNLFRGLLLFLLVLLVGLGLLVFNRQKLKIRSSKSLLEQQEKLLQVKERLIATEKENINLLEARMSIEVESQSKALTAQTVHLLEKNQMLEEIRQKLKKILEEETKDQKKWIRNLIKQIDFNFVQDADWEDFKVSFEKVHQDFFKSLSKNQLELTPSEMKLASLIRMNLSSKEISSTLGISQESLRISRYRLRKKLGLQKGESLQSYILCI